MLAGAEYLIFESNHDIEMLMNSNRPPFLKKRIAGKKGHLSNEQAAEYLSYLVTGDTKAVYLAHLSEECNKPELALEATQLRIAGRSCKLVCLKQNEATLGGDADAD